MAVGVFANCVFLLKVNHLSAQEKKLLKACIKDNGGTISFVLNKKCTHVIAENADALPARHLQNIKKNEISIVDVDFVLKLGNMRTKSCEMDLGKQTNLIETPPEKETCIHSKSKINKQIHQVTAKEENKKPKNERIFFECDPDVVNFHQEFEVAKYAAFEKTRANFPNEVAVIELQCLKEQFQIMVHVGLSNGVKKKLQYLQFETSEEACEKFHQILEDLQKKNYKLRSGVPQEAVHLASRQLQEMCLQDAIMATSVSPEVGTLVELLWVEALGHLDKILLHPVDKISLNDVSKAEGILLQAKKALERLEPSATLKTIMEEFYQILPHRNEPDFRVSRSLVRAKENLCQIIRDIVTVSEAKMSSTDLTALAKCRALRCMIRYVDPSSAEYIQVKEQVLQKNYSETPISILNIFSIGRASEAMEFESNIGNVQSLLHASAACNYVGILSRGLLLPKTLIEDYAMELTDISNLGTGIYFSDSISTSLKYSNPTRTDCSRLLVVCDVALGDCLEMHMTASALTNAPSGYQSVHGIREKNPDVISEFEDDEYVVYKTSQVKIKYIVQYCTPEDIICDFCPEFNDADLKDVLPRSSDLTVQPQEAELLDIKPLEEVKGGLLDSSGNPIPLEGVYIKGKILDLIAQVVVFQKYTNRSTVPIEAKYVFPLDSTAAVCGFEAFINGKHIIGEVKEKEEAHREYREAVRKGHGAYLMDQDAPDVFTVSVGNLPPNATVLIKITYITELSISCFGSVTFMVPGAVAPWQEDKALNENTQDTVEKICVTEGDAKKGEFSLDLSIEMPFKITEIWSHLHSLKSKKTDCKAVVSTVKNSTLDSSGFTLIIQLAEANVPRMWVEKHPEKESEACMLVFQPDFETEDEDPDFNEIIICLDCSNSMSSVMKQAKKIAILAVNTLHSYKRLNVIKFGSSYEEFSSFSRPVPNQKLLEDFIKSATPTMGNTDFKKPLRSLSLLAPTKGVQNIILISDGHIQDESGTLQMVKNNVKHTRVFTCGVGSTANRHMLRSLAKYGSGVFEYFDEKSKYSWENKIDLQIQRTESPGCNAVSIKWQQFGENAPVPVQAPEHIQSIFKSERVLIYGFVPHCTQAALHALIREQEIDTMVSTTELQKTTGTILHKLTARALIRDYEDGILHENKNEHEMKKHMLKSMIIELSKEYSIVTQFTSFVAIEKRDTDESPAEIPDIQQLMALEDVDILPYMTWEEDPDATCTIRKRSISEHSDLLMIEDDDDELGYAAIPVIESKAFLKQRISLKSISEHSGLLMIEDDDDLEEVVFNAAIPVIESKAKAFLKQRISLKSISEHSDLLMLDDDGDMIPVQSKVKKSRKKRKSLKLPLEYSADLQISPTKELFEMGDTLVIETEAKSVRGDWNVEGILPTEDIFSMDSADEISDTLQLQGILPTEDIFSMDSADEISDTPQLQVSDSEDRSIEGETSIFVNIDGLVDQLTVHRNTTCSYMREKTEFLSFQQVSSNLEVPVKISQPESLYEEIGLQDGQVCQLGDFSQNSFSAERIPKQATEPLHDLTPGIQSDITSSRLLEALPQGPQQITMLDEDNKEEPDQHEGRTGARKMPKQDLKSETRTYSFHEPKIRYDAAARPFGTDPGQQVQGPGASFSRKRFQLPTKAVAEEMPCPAPPALPAAPRPIPFHGPPMENFGSLSFQERPCPSLPALPAAPGQASFAFGGMTSGLFGLKAQGRPCPALPALPTAPSPASFAFGGTSVNLFGSSMAQEKLYSAALAAAPSPPSVRFGRMPLTPVLQDQNLPAFRNFSQKRREDYSMMAMPFFDRSVKSTCGRTIGHQMLHFGSPAPAGGAGFSMPGVGMAQMTIFPPPLPPVHPPAPVDMSRKTLIKASADPNWANLFELQTPDHYWELEPKLGLALKINFDYLIYSFLPGKGLQSLGSKGRDTVLRLIATLLVLQALWLAEELSGIRFKLLLKLDESSIKNDYYWRVQKAIEWARNVDAQYPGICSRIQLGRDWNSTTRQLLRIDPLADMSPLAEAVCGH